MDERSQRENLIGITTGLFSSSRDLGDDVDVFANKALVSDVDTAKEQLWNQLNLLLVCLENHVPKTPSVMYKDLVFLGGFMSSSDFLRLLQHNKTDSSQSSTSSSALRSESNGSTIPPSLNQDAKEDLSRLLPFF
jgi:hypothetical protein